jgi:hypothetical protein
MTAPPPHRSKATDIFPTFITLHRISPTQLWMEGGRRGGGNIAKSEQIHFLCWGGDGEGVGVRNVNFSTPPPPQQQSCFC